MKQNLLLSLGLALSAPLWAQDGPAKKPAADPGEKFEQLLGLVENGSVPVPERYAKFRDRIAAFAKKHRGTEPGLSAELWLLQGTFWETDKTDKHETAGEVAARILEYSFHSKRLDTLLRYGHVFSQEQQEQIFGKLIKVTKIPDIKGAAHYALAKLLNKIPGREGDAAKHIKILQDKYAGIPHRGSRLGALATALSQPASQKAQLVGFAIGDTAPEIEGVDLFGRPIRLSDHRGKIVVLDFWGDW